MRTASVAAALSLVAAAVSAQHSSLIEDAALESIISETSGALALSHFRNLLAYSGFAPSLGSEQTADFIAARAREFGLEDVRIEEFPSDGRRFFWAFRTEPWWEATRGELLLLDPETGETRERLASFGAHRIVLGRFSQSASLRAKLVDVGSAQGSPRHPRALLSLRDPQLRRREEKPRGDPGRGRSRVWRRSARGDRRVLPAARESRSRDTLPALISRGIP